MNLNPRIWRSGNSDFFADEINQAESVYTHSELTAIHDEGFDSIWLRGRLFDLMSSEVFPELNRPLADRRIRRLQELIQRGQECGVGVWLFFNEPLAIPASHGFWNNHPQVRGASHREVVDDPFWIHGTPAISDKEPTDMAALCISSSEGITFFSEAVQGLLKKLEGLAGVILITASEHHSHCWSHHAIRDSGFLAVKDQELPCPRCRERGAASVVVDVIQTWRTASMQMNSPCRVLAWNWSWSMWYPDPQKEIVERLPDGVEFLIDWERGGSKPWMGRTIPIDEYSMGYIGPSERFLGARAAAAARNIPVHAILRINVTHELATVPNLPLLPNLYAKWTGLQRESVTGVMGCWNFGCLHTLNTHAFRHFHEEPSRWAGLEDFLTSVAKSYFGEVAMSALTSAWNSFCAAFELYPFSFGIIYTSPINYAPAYPLDLTYRAQPMGPSHLQHEWGDRLEDTLGDWPLDDVIRSFESMSVLWNEGLSDYRQALAEGKGSAEHQKHRAEELICAEMIGCHLASITNIYRFHGWRCDAMMHLGLQAPCEIPPDEISRQIMRNEIQNTRAAIELVRKDPRLGFHQEAQAFYFNADSIEAKQKNLERILSAATH